MSVIDFNKKREEKYLKSFRKTGSLQQQHSNGPIQASNTYDQNGMNFMHMLSVIEENRQFNRLNDLKKKYRTKFYIFGITNKYRDSVCPVAAIIQELELIKFNNTHDKKSKYMLDRASNLKTDIIAALADEYYLIDRYISQFGVINKGHTQCALSRKTEISKMLFYFNNVI